MASYTTLSNRRWSRPSFRRTSEARQSSLLPLLPVFACVSLCLSVCVCSCVCVSVLLIMIRYNYDHHCLTVQVCIVTYYVNPWGTEGMYALKVLREKHERLSNVHRAAKVVQTLVFFFCSHNIDMNIMHEYQTKMNRCGKTKHTFPCTWFSHSISLHRLYISFTSSFLKHSYVVRILDSQNASHGKWLLRVF